MRWLSLVFAVVFAIAGIKALFAFDPNVSALSRPVLLLVSVAGTSLFSLLSYKAGKAGRDLSEFEVWLRANKMKILSGGASYNGVQITGETEVSRFLLTVSVIFLTLKIPSRYYISGQDNLELSRIVYTLASLLLGWWGIPWGPIYTIQAVSKNLSGGYKTTVREYLS